MVFQRSEQPFTDDQADQIPFGTLRGLEDNGQLASIVEISLSRKFPEKSQTTDCERDDIYSKSLGELGPAIDPPTDNSASSHGDASILHCVSSSAGAYVWSEHGKRPLYDDKPNQVTCKRPKQVDQNRNLDSCNEIPSSISTFERPSASADEDSVTRDTDDVLEYPSYRTYGKELNSPWFTCNRSSENMSSGSPFWVPTSPSCFEDHQREAKFHPVEEIFSSIFGHLPRKPVAIGRNHQADIPEWKPQGSKATVFERDCSLPSSFVSHHINDDECDKWITKPVMPMPDSGSLFTEVGAVYRQVDCDCLDEGSIRCVRQHVMEARENLKKALGIDRFLELGLSGMGEDVASKWTEEEEQMFQEVVLSNPFSLGKNFWDKLKHVFPGRSSKELVSYYFNVFMLRKRAEQNRSDPMNVDSDNDEWQESDDGEFAMAEEEDSVVESLTDRDDDIYNKDGLEVDTLEESEYEDDCDEYETAGEGKEEESCGAFEGCISDSKCIHAMQFMDKNLHHGGMDADVQDDSCTSFEGQHTASDPSADQADEMQHAITEDYEKLHMEFRNDGLSGITDFGFFDGHSDTKSWDINLIRRIERDDFLSTCNVIQEVFGEENDAMDGHDIC
ncbi:uncharacterized protein [Typha latifolia]|uniref:uncharacterized protein n=1 Tax=Typha latifolia TaxID=4733 RepID=UPI003C2EAE6C